MINLKLTQVYEKNRNVINPCCYRKKKINYCYEFMPSDIQVICGSMVNENRWSPALTETPGIIFNGLTLLPLCK